MFKIYDISNNHNIYDHDYNVNNLGIRLKIIVIKIGCIVIRMIM